MHADCISSQVGADPATSLQKAQGLQIPSIHGNRTRKTTRSNVREYQQESVQELLQLSLLGI